MSKILQKFKNLEFKRGKITPSAEELEIAKKMLRMFPDIYSSPEQIITTFREYGKNALRHWDKEYLSIFEEVKENQNEM